MGLETPRLARAQRTFGAVLAVLGCTAALSAQSLGELAQQEKERQKTAAKKAARSFTNDDLKSGGSGDGSMSIVGSSAPSPSPSASASPSGASEDKQRADLERQWRRRFADARLRIKEAESRCWITAIEPVLYNGMYVPMQVRKFVESEELRQARRDLEELEEELRRSGQPPGWGRE